MLAICLLSLFISTAQAQDGPELAKPIVKQQPITKTGEQTSSTQGEDSTTEQQPQAENILPALQAIESAIRDAIAEEDAKESERKEQREIDDLKAQTDMAHWAELMFWATAGTAGLTFFGLLLIGRTLHHTKVAAEYAGEAVDEAKKATVAAQSAVTVTQEMGEAQIRAYLSISGVQAWIDQNDGLLHIIISVTNGGQTPANDVAVRAVVASVRRNGTRTGVLQQIFHPADILPGASQGRRIVEVLYAPTPAEMNMLRTGQRVALFEVKGRAWYRAVIGTKRRCRRFSFILYPPTGGLSQSINLEPVRTLRGNSDV